VVTCTQIELDREKKQRLGPGFAALEQLTEKLDSVKHLSQTCTLHHEKKSIPQFDYK